MIENHDEVTLACEADPLFELARPISMKKTFEIDTIEMYSLWYAK